MPQKPVSIGIDPGIAMPGDPSYNPSDPDMGKAALWISALRRWVGSPTLPTDEWTATEGAQHQINQTPGSRLTWIDSAGDLAAISVKIPLEANMTDGQLIALGFEHNVDSFGMVSDDPGMTMIDIPASTVAGDYYAWRYRASKHKLIRVQAP